MKEALTDDVSCQCDENYGEFGRSQNRPHNGSDLCLCGTRQNDENISDAEVGNLRRERVKCVKAPPSTSNCQRLFVNRGTKNLGRVSLPEMPSINYYFMATPRNNFPIKVRRNVHPILHDTFPSPATAILYLPSYLDCCRSHKHADMEENTAKMSLLHV